MKNSCQMLEKLCGIPKLNKHTVCHFPETFSRSFSKFAPLVYLAYLLKDLKLLRKLQFDLNAANCCQLGDIPTESNSSTVL